MKNLPKPEKFGKVAVLYGGQSNEREVSLKSGTSIYESLIRKGVDAHLVDVTYTKEFAIQFISMNFDRAFIAMHGTTGEDGRIQAFLDILGIPFTGSKHEASVLSLNKITAKRLWFNLGLPTIPFKEIKDFSSKKLPSSLNFPVVVKPTYEGSTVGISIARNEKEYEEALEKVREFKHAFIEQYIEGEDYTVGIIDGIALPSIKIQPETSFYDYEAKYKSNKTQYHCPSGLPAPQEKWIKGLALSAFEALGCKGYGRVDFMRDTKGDFWLLEVNTVPGFTDKSLLPMAALAYGMQYDDLVLKILSLTLEASKIRV